MELIQNNTLASETKHQRRKVISYTSDGNELSCIYDDEWDFSGTHETGLGKTTKVSFNNVKPEFKRAIQETLYQMYVFYKASEMLPPSVTMVESMRRGLVTISLALDSTNWSLVDKNYAYKKLKQYLKVEKITKPQIEARVVPILNKLKDIGEISRLIDGQALIGLGVSVDTKQHIAIPIRMYQNIIEHSVKVVETYHS